MSEGCIRINYDDIDWGELNDDSMTILEELLKLSFLDKKNLWIDVLDTLATFKDEGLDPDLSIRLLRVFCKYFYDDDSSWASRMEDIAHEWFNMIEDDADEMKVKLALREMGKRAAGIRRV